MSIVFCKLKKYRTSQNVPIFQNCSQIQNKCMLYSKFCSEFQEMFPFSKNVPIFRNGACFKKMFSLLFQKFVQKIFRVFLKIFGIFKNIKHLKKLFGISKNVHACQNMFGMSKFLHIFWNVRNSLSHFWKIVKNCSLFLKKCFEVIKFFSYVNIAVCSYILHAMYHL